MIEDLKSLIALTASVSTILQFLSPILVCQKFVRKGSTGDISSLPFVSGFVSTTLWLRYGFLIRDNSLILVNTVGSTLYLAYVITFFMYSIKKSIILRQFVIAVFILSMAFGYSQYETDPKIATTNIGLLCCCMTILFFAAPLASLMHVLKVQSAESLPFPLILTTFIVSIQWFVYGLILDDSFIQIPNFLGCILSLIQLSLFICYPTSPKSSGYIAVNQSL